MNTHSVFVLSSFVAAVLSANNLAADRAAAAPSFDPPAVRAPSALTADAADGEAFLEWNPGLEDDLAGYRVYRGAPEGGGFEAVTSRPVEGT